MVGYVLLKCLTRSSLIAGEGSVAWPESQCLALMQSTHTGTVEALSSVPPMNLRFSYLNHQKFLRSILMQGAAMHCGSDSDSGKNMR
jgi:hypothetical protein